MFKEKKNKYSGKKKDSKNNKYLGGILIRKMAEGGAELLSSNADEVNKLNVFPVPDGDTGDNMRMTIESGIAALENIDSDDLAKVMKTLSRGMLLGARGNSGVILSQFFAGMAKGLDGVEKADAVTLGKALENGVKQAYASVMTPTEGTILTVAREAVEYAVAHTTAQSTIKSFFADLVKEMHASLDRTPEILTVLKEAGVVDSGGAGLLYIIEGFNKVLNGEVIEQKTISNATSSTPKTDVLNSSFGPESEMTYGYCTELLLQLQTKKTDIENFDIEPLKAFLCEIGDSVVAFKTESIVKLHVHTFTPEKVLEYCRRYGEFLTVKIENMSLQHSSTLEEKEIKEETKAEAVSEPEKESAPAKKYGVVAVCSGDGIEALYKELGTDEVVQGGQTQNPSTNDFLDSFAKVNAEHIFVFPNNGNIFMAAQQAGVLYKKATVHVIPSKNIGSGYVAVSSANFDDPDPLSIVEQMESAMKRVTAGYVSPSIRDADLNGIHINNGDTIGIVEKEIVVSDPNRITAAYKLAERLLSEEDKFMLSVFCGKDSSESEQEELKTKITESFPSAEVYFIYGGQDIYPYIFVAE